MPAKTGYKWVAPDVRTQYSLFRWSRLLNLWLGCIPIFEKDTSPNILSLEWVNVIECICHDQREAEKKGSFICICATSVNCICEFPSMISPWAYYSY